MSSDGETKDLMGKNNDKIIGEISEKLQYFLESRTVVSNNLVVEKTVQYLVSKISTCDYYWCFLLHVFSHLLYIRYMMRVVYDSCALND